MEISPFNSKLRLNVKDRKYSSWNFSSTDESGDIYPQSCIPSLIPDMEKMFHGDIFECTDSPKPRIISSIVTSSIYIPGVLMLSGNKTFGRSVNKKKLMYMCVPRDSHLPQFLIPYEIKIEFSKLQINKYILFKFSEWRGKHPIGTIVETIGDVSSLPNFYEYELYANSLHEQNKKLAHRTRTLLSTPESHNVYITQIMMTPKFNIFDRRKSENRVITIDSIGTSDFDDGLSISSPTINGSITVSIYIANLYVWFETLGLWNIFENRTTSIYLPDFKRPMLPDIISNMLCSLCKDETRFTMVLDITIYENGDIVFGSISNAAIRVSENYCYGDSRLNCDPDYVRLLKLTRRMNPSVTDSRDMVAHWMIVMNSHCAEYMHKHAIGIFRTCHTQPMTSTGHVHPLSDAFDLSSDEKNAVRNWKMGIVGDYVPYSKDVVLKHTEMGRDVYTHVTSPIRRLVDLINQASILRQGISESSCADAFINSWMSRVPILSRYSSDAGSVSRVCELMRVCESLEITDASPNYRGIWLSRDSGDGFRWVYIAELKLTRRVKVSISDSKSSDNNVGIFGIIWFSRECDVQKKIRVIHLCSNQEGETLVPH